MLIDVNATNFVDQTSCRVQAHRRGFNRLASRAEPCTEPGAVRSGLMLPMLGCMSNAGRGHEPVQQNEV